jgi:hypothetical protein
MEQYHGRDLTRAEWRAVLLAVIDGASVLVCKAGQNSGEIHDVSVSGQFFRLVWDPVTARVVTVLQDQRKTCKAAARVRGPSRRASVRIGRGFYDREGNRI